MSNQTVSTNLNIDSPSISGLNNNETITINSGATLTINSDNRWSQQAAIPNSINVDSGTGGTVVVDGREVWQVPFSASSGVVPTLTTLGSNPVIGGLSGATGEYLSVFASGALVPSTAGGAMPATGYIKLRTTSGTFQAGETITLPNGATVTAVDAGKRSWINFVLRNNSPNMTLRRLGNGLIVQGDWYEAGTTQGVSSETFQMPIADVYGGLFIEKSPGSASIVKDYTTLDRWALVPTAAWTAYNIGNDDANGKFFTCSTTGLITFGNGIVGKIPTAGCKVFIGNVIMSTAASTDYATNLVGSLTTTRGSLSTTMAKVFIDKATVCGYLITASSYFRSEITNSIGIDGLANYTAANGDSIIKHSIGGSYNIDRTPIYMANCYTGTITIEDITSVKLVGSSYRDNSFYLDTCKNFSIKRMAPHARRPFVIVQSSNGTIEDSVYSNNNEYQGCNNVKVINSVVYGRPIGSIKTVCTGGSSTSSTLTYNFSSGHDFQIGETFFAQGFSPAGYNLNNGSTITATTTGSITVNSTSNPGSMTVPGTGFAAYTYPVILNSGSTDMIIDGLSMHPTRQSPYAQGILSTTSNSNNVRMRNIGTRTNPQDWQSIPQYLFNISNGTNIKVAKVFLKGTRGLSPFFCNTVDGIYVSDSGHYLTSTIANDWVASNNSQRKRIGAGGNKTVGTGAGQFYNLQSNLGVHFAELEVSETETIFGIYGCEKTSTYPSSEAYSILAGNPKFNGSQGIVMVSGDVIEYTSQAILGVNGFNNIAPIFGGNNQTNHNFEYDIDRGKGWTGIYKTVNGANLSAETSISPEGFRIKIKITCTVTSNNLITFFGISMATSNALKDTYSYPLNNPKLTLTGAISGSDICVFNNDTNKSLICEVEHQNYTYYPWSQDFNATIRCRKPGYRFVELDQTLTELDAITPIEQTKWNIIPETYPGALDIGITTHSPISWNGLNWSITVQVYGAYSATQVANYINFHTAKDLPYIQGYRGNAWPEMVIENESGGLETARGIIQGLDSTLRGTRIIDISGNEFVGFARMQSDDGTYYVPPQYVDGTISGIIPGSRLRVYNSTKAIEVANEVVSGSSWNLNYLTGTTFDSGDLVKIYLTRQNGTTCYLPYKATSVATEGGWSVLAEQTLDAVYNLNGIDGETVSEFVPDYPNIQIDISDGDGITSVPRLYAFYCYIITSEDGIRYWVDAMEAVDTVNYKVNVDVLDLKLDNTISTPILIVGGRLYRSDGETVIASTSGSIQMDPDKVYVIETPTSGLTPEESAMLTKINKFSKLIPACIK